MARGRKEARRKAGDVLGGYRIERQLGAGSMGTVYAVRDPHGAHFALKVLDANLAEGEMLQRFSREAELAARVNHPNICKVHRSGAATDGSPFLVLELLEGEDLRACLRREVRLPVEALVSLCEHVCAGLAAGRDAGAGHRGLKPENIFFHTPTRQYKLLDFGIAKVLGGIAMTARGQILGTAEYMSPEQARGGEVDVRSDVYGLGCVLWEAAAGRPPFVGKNFIEVLTAHRDRRPEPLADHGAQVGPAIERVILRALEKSPEARFGRPEAMALAMRTAQEQGVGPEGVVAAASWTDRLFAFLKGRG